MANNNGMGVLTENALVGGAARKKGEIVTEAEAGENMWAKLTRKGAIDFSGTPTVAVQSDEAARAPALAVGDSHVAAKEVSDEAEAAQKPNANANAKK